jgi:hypothetical protein
MRGERGQASIEWIGAVMLVALTLGAAMRIAGRIEPATLAIPLLKAPVCAAKGNCGEREQARGGRAEVPPAQLITLPPLVPVPPSAAAPAKPRPAGAGRDWRRVARRTGGLLWRRAWFLCFGYERARYGLLHPETAPRQTVPLRGVLQMTNDCASPVDFARDWEQLRPR